MKPIKLTLSGFGPYADVEVIEFNQLGEQGIYLITGDTGAGKTTIFDGIIFALYGEASGTIRSVDSLRSKYAKKDTKTYVELEFMYRGETYHIYRNPEYMRPSKRGEGFTKERAEAILTLPDGKIIHKYTEVTKEVTQILGVNRAQFAQIAMIAQGDFLKLLLAKTEERSKIFREIFKTRPYQQLQERLKIETGKLKAEYEALKNSIAQYIDGILCKEDTDLYMLIHQEKKENSQVLFDDIVQGLEQLIKKEEETITKVSKEVEQLEGEITHIHQVIGKTEQELKRTKEIEQTKILLGEAERKRKDIKEAFEKAKEKEPTFQALSVQITKESEQLKQYKQVDDLYQAFLYMKQKEEKSKKELESLSTSRELCKKRIQQINHELERMVGMEKEQADAMYEADNIEKEEAELQQLIHSYKSYVEEEKNYAKVKEEYKNIRQCFIHAKSEYEEKERAYRDGQAGLLAKDLKEGVACPVCGSKSHPKLAILHETLPTQEELKREKQQLEKYDKEDREKSEEAGRVYGVLEEKRKLLQTQIKQILGEYEIEQLKEKGNEKYKQIQGKKAQIKEKLAYIDTQIRKKGTLEKEYKKLQALQEDSQKQIEEKQSLLGKEEGERNLLEQQYKEEKEKLPFDTEETAIAFIQALELEKEKIEHQIQQATKDYELLDRTIHEYQLTIETLEHQKEEFPYESIEVLYEKENHLTNKKEGKTKEKEQLQVQLQNNKRCYLGIMEKQVVMREVEKTYQSVKALSNTANGAVQGKDKIMLETYIQMSYFDQVLAHANTRLMVITSGQYELKRKEEANNQRSQSGLEIDVIDHYNGTTRSVTTLSGGESFVASLALALGLSDEIEQSVGGIQLDTMFIDEGFGTLSEDILNQAMKALMGLSQGNRLVGIISHVSELKERVEKQIIVTKEKVGGSHIRVQG